MTAGVDAYTAQVTVTAPGHPSVADILGEVAPGAACAAGGLLVIDTLTASANVLSL